MSRKLIDSAMLLTSLSLMAGTAGLQFISQATKVNTEATIALLLFAIILGISLHIGLFLTALNRSKATAKRITLAVMMAPSTIILLAITGEGIIDAIIKVRFMNSIQFLSLIAVLVYGAAYYSLGSQPKA